MKSYGIDVLTEEC